MKRNKKIYLSVLSVFLGFILGALILGLTGNGFLTIFTSFLNSTILDLSNFGNWIMGSGILVLTGLSVAFAYRAGLFNIGAEGQFIVGSFTAAYVGVVLEGPSGLTAFVALILGIFAGALYGLIPGALKAYYGVSEVVITIMLNWIALKYTSYLVQSSFHGDIATQAPAIRPEASIQSPLLSNLFDGAQMHWGLVVVILAILVYWFILEKTALGYELKAVGYNPSAAKYSGIKTKKMMMMTMMISGGFAGAAGAIYSLGAVDFFTALTSFGNYGFDGITVAFLGQMAPLGIILSGLLLGGLRNAGMLMNEVPKEIIDIIIGIILIFSVSGPILFKKKFTKKNKESQK